MSTPTTSINGKTAIFGLLGSNVSQSHSMSMHNAAFLTQNRNACYIPLSTTTEHFERAINGCKSLDFFGLNVTIPYKETVADYVEFTTTLAHRLGSINTVKRSDTGYSGANTIFLASGRPCKSTTLRLLIVLLLSLVLEEQPELCSTWCSWQIPTSLWRS